MNNDIEYMSKFKKFIEKHEWWLFPLAHRMKEHGRYKGKKEGYVEASAIYGEELQRLTERFIEQALVLKSEQEEYLQLIAEYEKYFYIQIVLLQVVIFYTLQSVPLLEIKQQLINWILVDL